MKIEKICVYAVALFLFVLAACEKNPADRIDPQSSTLNGAQRSASDSSGSDTTSVDSSANTIPTDSLILAGDIISIWPQTFPDTAQNDLLLQCSTGKGYPCSNNKLVAHLTKGDNGYFIKFDEKLKSTGCTAGSESTGTCDILIEDIPANFNGPIEISFRGKTYKGSIKRTGVKNYEFNWPYLTEIAFTRKTL